MKQIDGGRGVWYNESPSGAAVRGQHGRCLRRLASNRGNCVRKLARLS